MGAEAPRLLALRQRLLGTLAAAVARDAVNGDPSGASPATSTSPSRDRLPRRCRELRPGRDLDRRGLLGGEASAVLRAARARPRRGRGRAPRWRIGIGRFTTAADIDFAADALIATLRRLGAAGPPPADRR